MNDSGDDEQMKDDEPRAADANANGDASSPTPKIAFDFCAYQSTNESSSDDASRAQASTAGWEEHSTPPPQSRGGYNIEISIPALPLESRLEYEELQSNIVERVCSIEDESPSGGGETVEVEFTDGTLRK
ncbi:hypothetical protein E4U43_008025, partial [Claviceps pusilla]